MPSKGQGQDLLPAYVESSGTAQKGGDCSVLILNAHEVHMGSTHVVTAEGTFRNSHDHDQGHSRSPAVWLCQRSMAALTSDGLSFAGFQPACLPEGS